MLKVVSSSSILPEPLQNLFDLLGNEGAGTSEFVSSRVQTIMVLALGAIFLAAVAYSAFAAFRYIQSSGDSGKVEEASKAMKSIVTGIAVLFVSLIGIILIFVFFGAGLFGTATYQVCLSAANSPGCVACKADDGGLPEDWDERKFFLNEAQGMQQPTVLSPTSNLGQCTLCELIYFTASKGTDTVDARVANVARVYSQAEGCIEK